MSADTVSLIKLLRFWNFIFSFLRICHCLLILMGTIFTLSIPLIMTMTTNFQNSESMSFWKIPLSQGILVTAASYMGSVCLALAAAFRADVLGNRVRRAWCNLNAALLEYKAGVISEKELYQHYRESENLIGDLIVDPKTQESNLEPKNIIP